MKNIIAIILVLGSFQCGKPRSNKLCDDRFFVCAHDCAEICQKTIDRAFEFGKCFTKCNAPCRKDFCIEAIKRVGSSPSVSIKNV